MAQYGANASCSHNRGCTIRSTEAREIGGAVNIQKNQIRAESYLRGPAAKTFLGLLKKQQEEIEAALGYGLDWQVLPEGQDSRIAV